MILNKNKLEEINFSESFIKKFYLFFLDRNFENMGDYLMFFDIGLEETLDNNSDISKYINKPNIEIFDIWHIIDEFEKISEKILTEVNFLEFQKRINNFENFKKYKKAYFMSKFD